jgi:hypothetical protein
MNEKMKIKLAPEQETLLIPLYAKAQPGNKLFFDPKAQEILNQVDYDFTRLRVPYKTVVLVCQRAKKMDAVTREFLTAQPNGVVLHLGCGLDSRFWRVDDGRVEWYDLDMPPVIELRRGFFAETDRYHIGVQSRANGRDRALERGAQAGSIHHAPARFKRGPRHSQPAQRGSTSCPSLCAICHKPVKEGNSQDCKSCGSPFHKNCLLIWIQKQEAAQRFCPVCHGNLGYI